MTKDKTDKYVEQRSDKGDNDLEAEEIRESFAQDQLLDHGSSLSKRRRQEHTDGSPELVSGDADSTWDDADGEEAGGGGTPTTDENVVDEVGNAAGISYSDSEPLHTEDKLERREHDRWELNPESDPDFQERVREEFRDPRPPRGEGREHGKKNKPNKAS